MIKRRTIFLCILGILAGWLFWLGFQPYQYPDREDIQLKVHYLARVIRQPFRTNADFRQLEYQNPEWSLFSCSFSSFALTNIAFLDTSFKVQAIELIDLAIQKVLTDTVYSHYVDTPNPFVPEVDTTGSILYYGHLNMMLGCFRLLSKDDKYTALHDQLSASLYSRFVGARFHCLESYPGAIWIPDNAAGMASLSIHRLCTGTEYEPLFRDWVAYARQHWMDQPTGLLCSRIDVHNGTQLEEPRGSMLGWSIFFIHYFDKSFARELYEIYRDTFSQNVWVLRLFTERYRDHATNAGDIDSGPVVLGYSIPANAFAFGDAVALKDFRNARRLQRLIQIGSVRVIHNQELCYKTRLIDMPISPLAESLILYFETMTDWVPQTDHDQ
ncbi:MAG: hypothetical protein SF053_18540 [Bacteroidia bacterium]|nr:hypothetical protein [Bacteroidia bacterium]